MSILDGWTWDAALHTDRFSLGVAIITVTILVALICYWSEDRRMR